jgi:serpin B
MALAMAANGAEGETRSEILNAADIDDIDAFNDYSKELIDAYSKTDALKLSVANSIWINTDKTQSRFSDSYVKKINEFYDGEAGEVNNSNAVDTVNKWVSDKTNERIKSVTDSTDFDSLLLNAVYFKGRWDNEFSKDNTKPDTFTDRNGEKSQIDFMNRTGWYDYCVTNGTKIVRLPYKSVIYEDSEDYIGGAVSLENVSMYLIMDENKAVNPQETIDSAFADSKLGNTYMNLSIPKFKVEYSSSLKDMLEKLGVSKMFDESTAEFGAMYDGNDFYVKDVLHKTYVNVDEEGTEAAAVTAVAMVVASLPPEPIDVKYDKPFTFVIRDDSRGEVLFMGEYAFAE